MYRKISFLLLIIVLPVLLASCNDDPSSMGLNLLESGDLIAVQPDSVPLTAVKPYTSNIFLNGGNPILLGKYKNATAKMIVNFAVYFPVSTKKDSLLKNTRSVSAAWIEMTPKYFIGSESKVSFNLYRLNTNWGYTEKFNADSLVKFNGITEQATASYEAPSDTTLHKVLLSGQQVTAWLKDTTKTSIALYFDPTNTNRIAGFQNITNSSEESVMKFKVVLNNPVSSADTLTFLAINSLHTVNKFQELSTIPQGSIVLQGGTGLHSALTFDLSKIPAGAIINSAVLEMNLDGQNTDKGTQFFSALDALYLTSDDGTTYDSTMVRSISLSGEVYTGELATYVQKSVSKRQNLRVGLAIQNEEGTVDRIYIRNDAASKPKLKIVYTGRKP